MRPSSSPLWRIGRAVLADAGDEILDRAAVAVKGALSGFVPAGGVRIGAAAWLASVRRR